MEIPDKEHTMWDEIITGDTQYELSYLAIKILLSRTRLQYKQDPMQETKEKCINELRTLFMGHIDNPKVQQDLKTLMQGGNEK